MHDFTELCQYLERELDHCELLQVILLKERELIEQRNLGSLPAVLQQKADLLSSIEHTHSQKLDWLNTRKLPSNLSEFRQRGLNGQTVDRCLILWTELNQAKLACNESNTVNGIVIAKTRKRNGEQLDILKGIKVGKPLYDAAGKSTGGSSKGDPQLA
jgi:flagella synthesis protein FlgN